MLMEEITARKAEIETELRSEITEERVAELEAEVNTLEAEERAIVEQAEERKALETEIIENTVAEVVEAPAEENKIENEVRTMTIDSMEYRNAFYDYVRGNFEARTTLVNVDGNTAGTVSADAIAIPKTLDEKIWDNIHSAHPILADVTTINSGIALEVTKHTAIATRVTKKKDADTTSGAEDNTFVKVTLYGADYEKYVELTYAEAKMSNGALEQYLAEEIAAELGEALAKDVFAKIKSDAGSGRAVTAAGAWFSELAEALGKADRAVTPVVYCSAAKYYAIFGSTDDNGQPIFRDGVALGATVKIDSAAGTDVIVVDPKKFVLNGVQAITIESDKDIKAHKIVVSGYLRAEGCMRENGAAAYIA